MRAMRPELKELAFLFLRLGVTAFGGPAAHIAMIEDEVVERRKWLTADEFLDLLGATNLIPGPNSTELAIHIGHRRAGFPGLVVAGVSFIVPAALLTFLAAWAYVRFGSLPQAAGILYGVKPVIIAVVVQAIWNLRKSALKTMPLNILAIAGLTASFIGVNELAILSGSGLLCVLFRGGQRKSDNNGRAAMFVAPPLKLFLVFLKIGSILFGSGYVLLAFLRADLVDRFHWLTEQQLIDAVAVGQLTPGPVFSTATFIGYVVGGGLGALLATIGIFLPSFFFVALSGWLIPRVRRSVIARAFLDGVNVASLALMTAVSWTLARSSLVDTVATILAAASAILLFRFKTNSAWLVLGGAAIGFLLKR
jgi:chromate transporter